MKTSKKKPLKAVGGLLVLLLAGIIFFFTYYQVDEVQVMGSSHYSEKQIRKMVLRGPLASNSVLAPLLYTKQNTKDVPFIEGYTVTRLNRHTICVSVKEKDIVGCIPYLDSYIYFDRNGIFVEGSTERNEKIPFFDGIKMTRVLAILPMISEKKGILHAENVNDNSKNITLEQDQDESQTSAENWTGGYDEEGNYTGEGEYDENGNYVGPKPQTDLEYAQENWVGGYDEEGDYTGSGEYDANMTYVGEAPTEETMAEKGNWKGGYREDGGYDGVSEYDRDGNYVGTLEDYQASAESSGDGTDSEDPDAQSTDTGDTENEEDSSDSSTDSTEEEADYSSDQEEGAEDYDENSYSDYSDECDYE